MFSCEDDVVLEFQRSLLISFKGCEIDNQVVLDRKYGVGLKIWVVFREDLCCDRLVVLVAYLAAGFSSAIIHHIMRR